MPAITNIVFDMGGVLMDWDPVKISRPGSPGMYDLSAAQKGQAGQALRVILRADQAAL